MEVMNNTDLSLFQTIAKMKQGQVLKSMRNFLKKMYPEDSVTATQDYILCKGDIPILLCAHMDTVFKSPPQEIYYDTRKRVMWSPQGLGADDRAGVFSIMKLIQNGFRPCIALTTDEEIGGVGARKLVNDFKEAPFDIKYAIQLDRQGECDCVFYSCDNEEFAKYVENYGFVTDWGTFSDISVICPAWKIAGVNVSVGYLREHTTSETLHTNALYATIAKVSKMLTDAKQAPSFEYIPDKYDFYYGKLARAYGYNWPTDDETDSWDRYCGWDTHSENKKCQCVNCHKIYSEDDVFPVKSRKYKDSKNFYCLDCVGFGVNWCKKCGEPFEVDTPNDTLCPDCANKKLEQVTVV